MPNLLNAIPYTTSSHIFDNSNRIITVITSIPNPLFSSPKPTSIQNPPIPVGYPSR